MRVLLIAALFALATPALSQETPCDRLAGYPALPRIEGSAGAYRIADPAAAVAACEDARQQAPGDAFLAVLLARALLAADPQDPRAATLLTDAGQALPALAAGIMGSLYENGLAGLPASDRSARDQYRAGCDAWPDRMAAPGCTGFAAMRIEGRGGPGEPQAGFSLLDQQCRSGWPDACLRQAQLAELWGSAPPEDFAWQHAGRASAAHSTLIMGETNSSSLTAGGGLGSRPANATSHRREAEGATLVEARHDGYARGFGLIHVRRLYLSSNGEDLRGDRGRREPDYTASAVLMLPRPPQRGHRRGLSGAGRPDQDIDDAAGDGDLRQRGGLIVTEGLPLPIRARRDPLDHRERHGRPVGGAGAVEEAVFGRQQHLG